MLVKSASDSNDSDQVLGQFLKAFNEAAKPQEVLARYITQYPDRADSLLELAQMNQFLDRTQALAAKPLPPKHLGEFVLGRFIGGGGMGEIYEAYHERLQRRVAVKIIRRGWTNREARARFVREQQILAQLHQTHIVPIQTAGEEGEIQYFCMPYVNGASLNHVLGIGLPSRALLPLASTWLLLSIRRSPLRSTTQPNVPAVISTFPIDSPGRTGRMRSTCWPA